MLDILNDISPRCKNLELNNEKISNINFSIDLGKKNCRKKTKSVKSLSLLNLLYDQNSKNFFDTSNDSFSDKVLMDFANDLSKYLPCLIIFNENSCMVPMKISDKFS